MTSTQAPFLKKGIDHNLEALRGYAALAVVMNHIEALHQYFNSSFLPTLTIVLAPNGHLFVLVFFVLSGYVIGISHRGKMKGAEVKTYIKKRLVRIYPIYVVSILLALLVTQQSHSAWFVIANLLMLQTLVVAVFNENGAAWSLHFEMVYYALFIPISRFKVSPLMVLIISLVIALAGAGMLSAYFLGLVYWLSGLCIARYSTEKKESVTYNKLLAMLLLALALDQLLARPGLPGLVSYLTYHLPFANSLYHYRIFNPLINSSRDLIFLPFYVFIVAVFAGREFRYVRVCYALVNLVILLAIALTLYKWLHGNRANMGAYVISLGYYLLANLFWLTNAEVLNKVSKPLIKFGSWLGGISYALYIIHIPLLYFIGRFTFAVEPSVNYLLKMVTLLTTAITLAWLLDQQVQPSLKNFFLGRRKKIAEN